MSSKKKTVRENFRNSVFTRERNKCAFCDENKNLDAHHITDRNLMPNGGYVAANGIALCEKHHIMAEKYHISQGTIWEEGMHPNDLYKRIKSSYELAVKESSKI